MIGEPLPAERIVAAIPTLIDALDDATAGRAAGGILTTDTVAKGVTVPLSTAAGTSRNRQGRRHDPAGHGDHARVLATDVAVAPALLDRMLREAVDASFNRITVDGDTSTNDAVTSISSGAVRCSRRKTTRHERVRWRAALREACTTLAQSIVRDGEGRYSLRDRRGHGRA